MIGLRLRTEDMAKFGQLLLQNGEWNGRQLIPEAWIKEATSFKIKSQGGNEKIPAEINDWSQGYCYQMWRGRNNSVRLDGMAGQFVILVPDKDAIIVLTANAQNTQKEMDLVWKYLLPAIRDNKPLASDNETYNNLKSKIASLTIVTSAAKSVASSFPTKVTGKYVEFSDNSYGIQGMGFKFNDDICELSVKRDNVNYSLKSGLDKWQYSSTFLTSILSAPRASVSKSIDAEYRIIQPVMKLAASITWTDNNTLELTARFVEESLGAEGFICKFTEEEGVISVSLTRKGGRGPGMGPGAQTVPSVALGKIINK
jgi:hypothetical protein